MVAYHRSSPTFALSAGLRMWIKLSMFESHLMDGVKHTEFSVEVSVGSRESVCVCVCVCVCVFGGGGGVFVSVGFFSGRGDEVFFPMGLIFVER